MFNLHVFQPSPTLQYLVKFFCFGTGIPTGEHHRILPHGWPELILHLGKTNFRWDDQSQEQILPEILVTGTLSNSIILRPLEPIRAVGIVLWPGIAYTLGLIDSNTIVNKITDEKPIFDMNLLNLPLENYSDLDSLNNIRNSIEY